MNYFARRRLNALLTWLIVVIGMMLFTVATSKMVHRHLYNQKVPDVRSSAANTLHAPNSAISISSKVISVYLSKTAQVIQIPIEQYVAGVVAAEMPAAFELEALKAQAIASRTYIVRRIVEHDNSGVPVSNAMVTDTVVNQAYATDDQLEQEWKTQYEANKARVNQAVSQTQHLILTYNNKPINATFFSTSNGYTENSEDYWGVYLPYLRSVPSPLDELISPKFEHIVTMPYQQFLLKLGLLNSNAAKKTAPATVTAQSMQNIDYSQGHRIEQMIIDGKIFTGQEIREKLGLDSTAFTWTIHGDEVQIKTKGSGHGVGMSQWGAEGMALEGKSASDILKYYYTGVEIQSD